MSESYELGKLGEELVVEYLKNRNYQIIEQRWHDHHMEIDLLAFDPEEKELVSIEVKTRSTMDWGRPEDAVDMKKMKRMVYATDFFMKQRRISLPVRFDIFSVIVPKVGDPEIDHIKNAFYPPLG